MASVTRHAFVQASSHLHFRTKAKSLLTSTALIPVAGALAMAPTQALAQTVTWDGQTSTNVNTATNWNSDVAPTFGNTVILDDSALSNQPTINSPVTYAATVVSAGTLTVASTLTSPTIDISGTGVVNFTSGNIIGAINVQDGGTLLVGDLLRAEALITLNGEGRNGQGSLQGTNRFSSVQGPITLASNSRISAIAGFGFGINGVISGNGQTVTFGGPGTINVQAGSIRTGSGSVIKEGAGILGLAGANTYTGDTLIRGGSIQAQGGSAMSDTGRLTVDSGTSVVFANNVETIGSLSGSGLIGFQKISTNSGLIVGDATSTTFSGQIREFGDGGTLEKRGTGTLTLTGANDYVGLTTVSEGAIRIGGATALGTTAGSTTVADGAAVEIDGTFTVAEFFNIAGNGIANSGALRFVSGNATLSGLVTLSANTRINSDSTGAPVITGPISGSDRNLILGGSGNQTISGALRLGAGALTKDGTGTVTLSGANTYTGATTVSSGTLTVTNSQGLGTAAGATTIADGATVALSSDLTLIGENFTISGSGVGGNGALRSLVGFTATTGTVTLAADALITSDSAGLNLGNVAGGGNVLRLGGFGRIAINGAIANLGELITGSQVTLFGTNSFTGRTTVNGGILDLVGGSSLSDTARLFVNGAFARFSSSETIGSLAGSGTVQIATGSPAPPNITLTTGGDNTSSTFTGRLQGAGSLIKTGTGTFTLTDTALYSGTTTINGGVLQLGNGGTSGALGTGAVTIGANGTLAINRANAVTISNAISGTGTLMQAGMGTTTLSGGSGFTGDALVSAGQLRITGDFGGAVTIDGGTLSGTSTIAGPVVINSGGTLAAGQSPGTMTVGALTLNTGSITNFELGEAGVAGGLNNDLIRVTGNLALNGGTINVARGTGFGAGAYTLFEFGTLSGALGNMTLTPLDGNFIGTLAVDGNTVLLNAATAEDLIFWNGTTTSPTGAVVGGSGTWDLTGNNFTEDNGVSSGPWAGNGFQAVFAGATGGTVTIAPGVTLAPAGLAFLTDSYVIAGGDAASNLAFNGPTGIDTATGIGATIAAPISGTGSVTKTGAGTLTLGGVNTYSGSTTVLGGTLVNSGTITGSVANNAALTSTGSLLGGLTNNSGAVANLAGIANGQVSNSGTVNVTGNLASNNAGFANSGASVLTVSGGDYTGVSVINNNSTAMNSLNVSAGRTLSAQIITNGATSSILNAGTITTSNRIDNSGTLTTTGTINGGTNGLRGLAGSTTNAAGTINGAISNAGTFNVTGNLANDNAITNTGTLNLTGATLTTIQVSNNAGGTINAAGALNGAVQNAGTFNVTGNLTSNNSFVNTGTGVLDVSGGSYTGSIAITNNSTAAAAINVASGRTLSAQIISNAATSSILNVGTITTSNRIDNSGTVTTTGTINGGTFGLRGLAGSTTNAAGTINGAVSNAGTFNVTGNLANDNAITNTGTLNLTGATLTTIQVNNNAGGTANAAGALNGAVQNAGTFNVTGNLASNNSYLNFDSGVLNVNGGNFTGLITVTNSASATSRVNVASGRTLGAQIITNFAAASIVNAGTITVSNRIDNRGSLTSTGTINGTLTNAMGGAVNLAGALNGAVSNSGMITLTGATAGIGAVTQTGTGSFGLGGFNTTIGSLAGDGLVSLGTATLTVGNNGTSTCFGGVISGDGGITKTGSGTFTLTGVNSYVGETRIDGGSLTLASGGVIVGQIRNGGSFTNAGTVFGRVINSGDLTSTGTVQGGLTQSSGTSTMSGILNGSISSAGTLIVDGNLASNDFAQTSGSGLTQILGNARWSGLTGFTHASTNTTGLVIAGELDVSGIVTTQAGATTIIGGGTGTLTATNMANLGTVTNNGTVNSDVTNAGTISNNFVWNGGLSQGTGSATNAFRWNGFFLVDAGGTITNNGTWDNSTGFLSGINDGLFENFGTLSGGGVNVSGANAVLANRAGGVITLASGALLRADSGGTITNAGDITGNAQVNAGGIASNIAGSTWNGALAIAANGSLNNAGTITGTVTNTGSFASTGTLTGALVNDAGGTANLAGALNGTVSNTGAITLTGATTGITALTQMVSGTFDLAGFSTTVGGLSGGGAVLLRGGNLTVDTSVASTTFAGVISGSGGLVKTGLQTFTLSGANTFTGSATINGGSLVLATGASLAGAVQNNATFSNAGDVSGLVTNNGTLASTGVLNGGLANAAGASAQLANVVSGTISNAGAITLTADLTGGATMTQASTGTFNLAGFGATLGSLAGSGTVSLSAGTLTVGGNGTSTSFGGVISGTGNVVKTGAGTLSLTGANTFTGATQVNAGGLTLVSGAVLASQVNNSATFTNAGTVNGLVANSGTLVSTGTLNGNLSNATGGMVRLAGQLNGDVANASAITLTGDTTVVGDFAQDVGGTLDLGSFAIMIGSLSGSGTITLGTADITVGSNSADTRFDGVIAGSGGLTKTGSGTFVLGGANSYTGLTTIGAGTLSLGSAGVLAGAVTNTSVFANAGGVAGLVTNNGVLASTGVLNGGLVNASGASATLAGSVSGSFSNAGTVMVVSGTTLAASPLANTGQVQNAGTWTGDVTNGAGAMFENTATGSFTGAFDNRGTLLSTGSITGRLTNSGAAQLAGTVTGPILNIGEVLTSGNLTHTGEVTNSGMFTVGAGTFATSGTFTNSGSLFVNSGATMALGTATLRNSGSNALIDVAGTLRGRVDLASGTLIGRAGSLLAGDVLIASGAAFMSGGTVTGTATINGTLMPGNSPGTLTVNGTLALGGSSTTVFEMTNAVSDRIVVNGTASIASGATLVLTGVREATPGQAYSLISTTGGISGSFTNIVKDRSVFGFIRQDADSIDLLGTLTLPTGITAQGTAAVNYLNERLLTGTVSDAGLAFTPAIAALDGSAVAPVIARLNPEPYASAATMALENGLVLAKTVRAVAVAGTDEDNGGLFVFGQGFAGGRDMAARPFGTAPAAQAGEGFLGGIGYGTSALGFSAFVGRSSVRQEIAQLGAQTSSRGTFFGAKAQAAAGGVRFTVSAIFDRSDADTSRTPVGGAAQGRYTLHGDTYDAELAFDLPIGSDGLHLRPSAGVTHSRVTRGAVAETGGGAASLSVVRQSYKATWINGDIALRANSDNAIQPWVGVGVRHLANGDPIRATGTLAGFGGQFTVEGAQALRTFAHASGGVSATLAPGLSAYLTGEVDVTGKGGARQVQGGIRYAF